MRRALLVVGCFCTAMGFAGAPRAEPGKYFIAVHCDPQHASEPDWVSLTALVAAAVGHEQKLTVQLNPQWESIIASVPGGPGTIASWEDYGHEIAGHHHIWGHSGGWDGYSNEEGAEMDADYLGDMQQWLAHLKAILPEGTAINTVSSKDHDFPSGVDFQTGGTGSTPNPNEAASVPTLKTVAGGVVWNLNHAALIAGGTWQVDEMMTAFDAATPDQVFGVAVHPHDYYPGNRTEVDRWLLFLKGRDPDSERSVTAGAVLQAHVDSLEGVPAASVATLMLLIAAILALGTFVLRR